MIDLHYSVARKMLDVYQTINVNMQLWLFTDITHNQMQLYQFHLQRMDQWQIPCNRCS